MRSLNGIIFDLRSLLKEYRWIPGIDSRSLDVFAGCIEELEERAERCEDDLK